MNDNTETRIIIRFDGMATSRRTDNFLFLGFLLISILPLMMVRYIPSLDSGQHLNTSNVIVELFRSNAAFSQIFEFNRFYVGYWTGHLVLSFFNAFLPDWLAEKLLFISYLAGISYAFRYLVKSISGRATTMSLLIIPFSFTGLMLMGYYNYNLAYIFFFLSFGYYIRHQDKLGLKSGSVLFLLVNLIYFSHALVFVFFGASLVIYIIARFIIEFRGQEMAQPVLRKYFRNILILLIVSIPTIIMWYVYYMRVSALAADYPTGKYSIGMLLTYLRDLRSLIVFHYEQERIFTRIFTGLLAFLLIYLAARAFKKPKEGFSNRVLYPEWLAMSLVMFLLYLFFPDRSVTGNVSNRISILAFFLLVTWLSVQRYSWKVAALSVLVTVGAGMGLRATHFYYHYKLNKEISQVTSLRSNLEDNATLVTINNSDNWVHLHFGCYLGSEEPIVNLGNPQCWGQFPVIWNYDRLPALFLGDVPIRKYQQIWPSGPDDREHKTVNYILLIRPDLFQKNPNYSNYKQILEDYYKEVAVSSGKYAALYRLDMNGLSPEEGIDLPKPENNQ